MSPKGPCNDSDTADAQSSVAAGHVYLKYQASIAWKANITHMNDEHILELPDGRKLAYSTSGNASSKTILLYLHGAFTIGETANSSRTIASKNVLHVRPTLPGWGNTSPPPPSTAYVDCLCSDMTALLDHLRQGRRADASESESGPESDLALYVAGGSFGTVPAQMLYGAPYDKFPYGRRIAGVLLMGSAPPFRYYTDYARHMTWSNYLMAGPVAAWWPVRFVIVSLVKIGMARHMSSVDRAEKFLRGFLFDKMDEAEKEEYAQWREREGIAEGETERRFASNAVRSVATSWEGFKLMAPVLHSDWGFRPDGLDEEHSRPLVMIVTGTGDKEAPEGWSQYLAATYKNTKVKTVHGGHIGILYHLESVWAEFLERALVHDAELQD